MTLLKHNHCYTDYKTILNIPVWLTHKRFHGRGNDEATVGWFVRCFCVRWSYYRPPKDYSHEGGIGFRFIVHFGDAPFKVWIIDAAQEPISRWRIKHRG